MTRVCLYSDQPVLARGLESVLTATGQFRLESSSFGIPKLAERFQADAPDILLLDLTPEVTLGVLSDIKRVVQESKLVLWVGAISTELAFQALGLGVRGILRKTLPAGMLVKCLQKVHKGELWFEKALTDSFLTAERVVLSRREGQLVTLLSCGLKNKEIGSTLHISESTVKVYFSRLFQKAGVKDRLELALFGLKNLSGGEGQLSERPSRANHAIHVLRSLVLQRP
jgi:two-component system nitrate/nitrite response regulator NarL